MRQSFDRAWMLYQQSRYQLAVETLQSGLLDNPEDADSHALWAICLLSQKQFQAAEAKSRESISYDPESGFVSYAHAWVMFIRATRFGGVLQNEKFVEAKQAIDRAIEIEPFNAHFHELKARMLLMMEKADAADEALDVGLAVEPDHEGCLNLKSKIALASGRKDEAIKMARHALLVAPDSVESHTSMGRALAATGQHEQSLVHLREALRLNPNDEQARDALVNSLKSRSKIFRILRAPGEFFFRLTDVKRKRLYWLVAVVMTLLIVVSILTHQAVALVVFLWAAAGLAIGWVMATLFAELMIYISLRQDEATKQFLGDEERAEKDFALVGLTWAIVSLLTYQLSKYSLGVAAVFSVAVAGLPLLAERLLKDASRRDLKRVAMYSAIAIGLLSVVAVLTAWTSPKLSIGLMFAASFLSVSVMVLLFAE